MLANTKKRKAEDKTILPKGIFNEWNIEQINETQYFLRLKNGITQTGSEFSTDLIIPFHHKIMEVYAYHYTAAGALSTDNLTFKWYTGDGTNWRLMFAEEGVGYTSFGVSYQDEAEGGRLFNPCTYRFTTNTTNTDVIAVSMRLEVTHK